MNKKELLALKQIRGIGDKSLLNIINSKENINSLINSNYDVLSQYIKGKDKKHSIKELKENFKEYFNQAAELLESFTNYDIKYISYLDKGYPQSYKNLKNPPPCLFVKGNINLLNYKYNVAIIGARNCTEFGKKIAFKTAEVFTENKFNIVSGLASGIDTASHNGALSANGYTTAIIVDLINIFPEENIELANNIINNEGLLLSENIPGTKPNKGLFISRDRLQSSLCSAIFVIETEIKGGTMYTVNFAEEQNKQLFCPDLTQITNYPKNHPLLSGIKYLLKNKQAISYTAKDYQNIINQIKKIN